MKLLKVLNRVYYFLTRLNAVEDLMNVQSVTKEARAIMKSLPDLERILRRFVCAKMLSISFPVILLVIPLVELYSTSLMRK